VKEGKMRIKKDLVRKVLQKLYEDYYPEACPHKLRAVEAVVAYLEEKGLVEVSTQRGCRITAEGIDKVEGGSLI
jgi:predicted methyltransferase